MKDIILVLCLILIGLLLFGCVEQLDPVSELPSDFELSYRTGALHADWGTFSLNIDNNKSIVKKSQAGVEKEYPISFTKNELLEIYNFAREQGFFSLNTSYNNSDIMDGGGSWITIIYDGKSKTVSVINTFHPVFEAIESLIREKVIEKLGEDAFNYVEFR